jgi:hypothetical protein
MVTKRSISTPAQAGDGAAYRFYLPPAPRGARIIVRFSGVAVAPASS